MYIMSPENLTTWNALWNNQNGFQDKFTAFQQKVSSYFANNTNVIGYDPINEPQTSWSSFSEYVHFNM